MFFSKFLGITEQGKGPPSRQFFRYGKHCQRPLRLFYPSPGSRHLQLGCHRYLLRTGRLQGPIGSRIRNLHKQIDELGRAIFLPGNFAVSHSFSCTHDIPTRGLRAEAWAAEAHQEKNHVVSETYSGLSHLSRLERNLWDIVVTVHCVMLTDTAYSHGCSSILRMQFCLPVAV